MKLGSLFSGGGLGDFGFMAAGIDITWQCEIDEYCQKILALRYPESKKYRDIKTLKGDELEPIDILTGGFPCQPFSVAGKQKGKEDNRYLWPEMLRVIKECRPRWIVGENVPGIINMALDTVCSDLEAEGYEVWPVVFPSCGLEAPHKRDRLWCMAHSRHDVRTTIQESRNDGQASSDNTQGKNRGVESKGSSGSTGRIKDMANSEGIGIQGLRASGKQEPYPYAESGLFMRSSKGPFESIWNTEPPVGRVANGIADRVHRLKMLGNGQVPACTYVIGKMIMEIENNP